MKTSLFLKPTIRFYYENNDLFNLIIKTDEKHKLKKNTLLLSCWFIFFIIDDHFSDNLF
jgi:hypothetical protein